MNLLQRSAALFLMERLDQFINYGEPIFLESLAEDACLLPFLSGVDAFQWLLDVGVFPSEISNPDTMAEGLILETVEGLLLQLPSLSSYPLTGILSVSCMSVILEELEGIIP